MMADARSVPVTLPNGRIVLVEVADNDNGAGALERLESGPRTFDELVGAIEGVAMAVQNALARVKPTKASVELGFQAGLESGKLTALLVKGTGSASLKVTLTWE